ncbi:molybdopterin-dependent oxidoreductase, partial [bacterium]|nr:molybdopterin-dependent oxidoreductase [bacterium]MBU1025123.1 molybdopterin-dependent oxidoreductase [bacterium]
LKNLPTFEQVANSKAVLNVNCDLVSEVPMLALKMRKTMLNSGMKPFNIVSAPSNTSKLMPEIVVPLDKYSAFLADLIRQLVSNDKITEETRNKILDSLAQIPTLSDAQFKQTIDTIVNLIRSERVALLIGSNILKSDSDLLKLTKILIELIEKLQQIPVIMPILFGGNSAGAELLKVHPMLPSSGAGGDKELTGGQSADEMIFAAIHGKIKTLIVFSNRFAMNLPKYELKRGLEKLDYLIWADYFLSELNEHADLLLPLQSPYEKTGCVVNNEGRFDILKPSIKPADGIKPTLYILSKVAAGLDNSCVLTPESLRKEIMTDERFGEKLSPGGFVFVDTKRDFIGKVGTIKEHALPETNAKFPFVLLPVKQFWPGDKTVLNSPVLVGRLPEFYCSMNDEDAANRKMKTGDTVEISTEHGSIKAKLVIEKKLPKGYVTIPMDYMEKRLGVLMLSGKNYFKCQVGQVFSN